MLKPSGALGDAEAAAICEIAPVRGRTSYWVKIYKKAARDAIARHLGMFLAP